jgi:hypothetical protein
MTFFLSCNFFLHFLVIKALDPDPDEMNADPQPWLEAAVCCCDPNHGCDYDCGAVVMAAVAVMIRHEMGGVVGCAVRQGSGIRESEAVLSAKF